MAKERVNECLVVTLRAKVTGNELEDERHLPKTKEQKK